MERKETTDQWVAICLNVTTQHESPRPYDPVASAVHFRDYYSVGKNRVLKFNEALRMVPIWDPSGMIAAPQGGMLKKGCDPNKRESWILNAEWASPVGASRTISAEDGDVPYVRCDPAGRDRAITLVAPTRIWHLNSIHEDVDFVFRVATCDWVPNSAAAVMIAALSPRVNEAIDKCLTVIRSGKPYAHDIFLDVLRTEAGQQGPPNISEITLRQFGASFKRAAAAASEAVIVGALSYLMTPVRLDTLCTLEAIGVRPPFGLIHVQLAPHKALEWTPPPPEGGSGKAEDLDIALDPVMACCFIISHHIKSSVEWWQSFHSHSRFIQAAHIPNKAARGAFGQRNMAAIACKEYFMTVGIDKTCVWHDVPDETPETVIKRRINFFPSPRT